MSMARNKTMSEQLTDQVETLNRNISYALAHSYVDGYVPMQNRLMRAARAMQHGIAHVALMNGMTVKEIAEGLGITEAAVDALLTVPFTRELQVGAVVKSKEPDNNPLHCGSGVYGAAVVIQVEPFIMASHSGDMRWSTWKMDDVEVIDTASDEVMAKAMTRLEK